ncbi:MAG: response regulator [Candidatus Thorarchaeota archaeon]
MIGEKPHIMIVDDNVNLSKMMARILKMKGFEVTVTNGGHQAVETAIETPTIDIVFMDIKMPDINGVEAYKRLKRFLPDTRVVMMTAYAVEELIQDALHEGAYGVLYKPVNFDEVVSLIGKLMEETGEASILVVDDEDGIRTTFEKTLTKKGHSVKTASSGEEAVKLAEDNPFDILFIDMKLPGIDGLDTYLSIKLIRPNAVAIIVTGHALDMTNRVERLMLSSAYSCLRKPVDMAQVFGVLDEILSSKQVRQIVGGM